MPTSPAVKPIAAPARQDLLSILGTELLLVGALAAVIAGRAPRGIVFGMCALIAAMSGVFSALLTRSAWRPTTQAIVALCFSFASTLPGILFFVDLPNRNGVPCYELPSFSASLASLLVGPVFVVLSTFVSPWRLRYPALLIVRSLHALVWLLGAGNTMGCAMAI